MTLDRILACCKTFQGPEKQSMTWQLCALDSGSTQSCARCHAAGSSCRAKFQLKQRLSLCNLTQPPRMPPWSPAPQLTTAEQYEVQSRTCKDSSKPAVHSLFHTANEVFSVADNDTRERAQIRSKLQEQYMVGRQERL